MVYPLGVLGAGCRWVHCGGPACGKDTTPFTGPSRRWNTGRCRTLLLPNSRGLHSSCARAVRQRVGCATNAQVQKNRWLPGINPLSAGRRLAWSGNQKAVSDIGMRVYSLRLTRLHSSVEANRHSRSASPRSSSFVRREVASVSCGELQRLQTTRPSSRCVWR